MRYAELHCRTNFSFLEGASHPDEFVRRAAELNLHALAVTDRNSLAGVVRAHGAAKEVGLKLLIGAEITPLDALPIALWAMDRAGYGRLTRLITRGRRAAPKGECRLTFDDIADHADGLLAGVVLRPRSNTDGNETLFRPLFDQPQTVLAKYRELFGDRCYALAELHQGPNDRRELKIMQQTADQAGLPLAAANDVHFHVPERQFLQDVLTAIRLGRPVSQLTEELFPNASRHLKSAQQMTELFADCPAAVARTAGIADRCTFSLDELRYEYPEELCPPGMTPLAHLTQLTWQGALRRYPHGLPDKVRRLIEHELTLIEELRYEAYFLTVWDLVRFARSRDILCQGRGSAANSAVCYCLEVTSVDPDRIDVLFERFISKERDEAPDIDVDFEHERREEVLQYIYEKYGRDRAGMTAEVITYRPRSAVRDVGKALGLSLDRVDRLAKSLERVGNAETLRDRFREAGLEGESRTVRQFLHLVQELLGFPRHLSQHVGGMVITHGLLSELVPIENAAMPDRTVIEWDKDDLDALGLLKVDCLGLGMLTAIHKGLALIEQRELWSPDRRSEVSGKRVDDGIPQPSTLNSQPSTTHHSPKSLSLADIPPEDPAVYEMICRADTLGVFQIESRAQMSMLPRLKPKCFYDLVIEVAIVRPGPIQGNMVHPYLKRRKTNAKVEYPNPEIEAVLEKTLGVPIFQEQAMQLAVVAAGFTPGEADQLRRAMAAWRRPGMIDQFRQKFIDGMTGNGYSLTFAEQVFRQIRGFGEYGFPESHAASFALLVYVSAWLKCYYPAAFAAAILNSQPMGFYAPAQLIRDAREHGVEVLPVDINASVWDCTLEESEPESETSGSLALRLGFRMVSGLKRSDVETILRCREEGPFQSITDFTRRTKLFGASLRKLAQADLFRSLGRSRREAFWDALPIQKSLPLLDSLEPEPVEVSLPEMTRLQEVTADYRTVGLSLRDHPMRFVRSELDGMQVMRAEQLAQLPANQSYRVAGLVLLRQRPSTAKGVTFVTLEDETGIANLIIRMEVWERYRRVARSANVLMAHGLLQRQEGVIHILVDQLHDLSPVLAHLQNRSRDFR